MQSREVVQRKGDLSFKFSKDGNNYRVTEVPKYWDRSRGESPSAKAERHSAAEPQPKLASVAEASSRKSRYGRAEAQPCEGVEILLTARRI
jgi:hypothetical protein